MIIVNCKTYLEATGDKAVRLAKICERVHKKTNVPIGIAVQACDLRYVVANVHIPVFAQHVDTVLPGAHTGHTLLEAVADAGAAGTLINHSERRLPLPVVKETIKRVKDAGLIAVACAPTPPVARQVARFEPHLLAIEPPELIGGNRSVSTAKPQVIEQTTKHVTLPVLCGAGVSAARDVEIAVSLGAQGILVASHVVKAANPEKVLMGLARPLKGLSI